MPEYNDFANSAVRGQNAAQPAPDDVRDTIDITPTPEGFANIARRFAGQIIDDLPRRRVADDRFILDSFIEIVAWLAATGRGDLIARIRDDVAPTRREHKPAARARLAEAIEAEA